MYTVKIQMYNRRSFTSEDDIGMSKHVLLYENIVSFLKIVVTLLFVRLFNIAS